MQFPKFSIIVIHVRWLVLLVVPNIAAVVVENLWCDGAGVPLRRRGSLIQRSADFCLSSYVATSISAVDYTKRVRNVIGIFCRWRLPNMTQITEHKKLYQRASWKWVKLKFPIRSPLSLSSTLCTPDDSTNWHISVKSSLCIVSYLVGLSSADPRFQFEILEGLEKRRNTSELIFKGYVNVLTLSSIYSPVIPSNPPLLHPATVKYRGVKRW